MGYFSMSAFGHPLNVPPNKPPAYVPLQWCPDHAVPKATCNVCVEANAVKNQPKPPFKIYEGVAMDFAAKNAVAAGAGASKPSSAKGGKKPVHYKCNQWLNGVLMNIGGNERRARVVCFVVDRSDYGWMLVEQLYSFLEASALDCQLPQNFNRRQELVPASVVPQLSTNKSKKMAAASTGFFTWVLVKEAIRSFDLKYCPKAEIDRDTTDETISKVGRYYVRHEF